MVTVSRDLELTLAESTLTFKFHRVPRRRHVHLLVDDDGELHVRAPYRCSAVEAERVIRENHVWVLRTLSAARRRVALRPALESGAALPLLDEQLTLRLNPVQQWDLFAVAERVEVDEIRRCGDELRVRLSDPTQASLKARLELWYRDQAERVLPSRLALFSAKLAVTANRVTIRAQKTCWGSCSGRGNISLNWRLMLLPGDLADYVIVHELCHLRFLDHSPAFWRLVGSLVPDYQRKRQALRIAQGTLVI